MAEIESFNNCWSFKEEWVGAEKEKWSPPEESPDGVSHLVQPAVEGRKKVTPIPPRPTKSAFGQITSVVEPPAPSPVEIKQQKNSSDPVWLMMDKAKKFETPVEMSLIISLPTKSLYDVARESFEEGGDKVIEYIISNLDDNKIKDSLRLALHNAYGDFLNGSVNELGEPIAIKEPVISGPSADKNKNAKNE